MRILHLIIGHQVVERELGRYERLFPNCNDVLIFSDVGNMKHLRKYSSCPQITHINVKRKGKQFDFSRYNYIVAHYLTTVMIDFISYAPSSIHVSWDIYGADLYNQFLEPRGYQLQYSSLNKYLPIYQRLMNWIGLDKIIAFVRFESITQFKCVNRLYFNNITKRLDSVQIGCTCDGDLLDQYSGMRFTRFRAFNYSLKEVLGDYYGIPFNDIASDVMIGNSASLSNNHLYVLSIIKDIDFGDSRVIIPLSYGGVQRYKNAVVKEYMKSFSNNADFIFDYMPLQEYNKLFLNLKTMIMSSWRQESVGTIVMGLYLGVKVFMSKRSPLYESYKKDGFILFELESSSVFDLIQPLSDEEKIHNRSLLEELYDEKVIEAELKRQFV